jgi:enoyl-CoA hydratase/carnithine racemase
MFANRGARTAVDLAEPVQGVARLTLQGREKGNFLDTQALLQLAESVSRLRDKSTMRALIITGQNGTFCGGRIGAKGLTRASDVAEDLNTILKVNAAFNALSVPVIAAIEGQAFGFAFGLTAQADYAVAAENALFALPEMSHGMPPLIVLSYLFRFVPYKRAFELALTSREISAQEAAAAGIVTDIAKPGTALDRAMEIARKTATMDATSIALLRKFARHGADASNPPLSEYAVSLMSVLLAERTQRASAG